MDEKEEKVELSYEEQVSAIAFQIATTGFGLAMVKQKSLTEVLNDIAKEVDEQIKKVVGEEK